MPSPIGHALGGLIVGLAIGSSHSPKGGPSPTLTAPFKSWPASEALLLSMAVACLPDVDFLWGRHSMETHSVGFALLVGGLVWLWAVVGARRTGPARSAGRLAVVCVLAVGSHVLFDWLGSDDSPPLGVMALWPVSNAFYFAEAFVFEAISRRHWLPGFIQHNVLAVVREVVILAPIAGGLWWIRVSSRTTRS